MLLEILEQPIVVAYGTLILAIFSEAPGRRSALPPICLLLQSSPLRIDEKLDLVQEVFDLKRHIPQAMHRDEA